MIKIWCGCCIAVLLWTGCSEDEKDESLPDLWQAFIVCEGNYGTNNGEITLFDSVMTDTTFRRAYAVANGRSLGNYPHAAWFMGNSVWVTVTGSNRVVLIDPATLQVSGTIDNLQAPRMGTTDGVVAYITEFEDSTVAVVDPLAKSVTQRWKLGHKPDEIVRSGDRLFVSSAPGQNDSVVSVIDLSTGIIQAVTVGYNPISLAAVPRLNSLYVACAGSATRAGFVAVLDMTTLSVQSTIGADGTIRPVRLVSQDPWIAFIMAENGNIRLHHVDTGEELETTGRNYYALGWGKGELMALDARDFVGHGEAHWLATDLTVRKIMSTDASPVNILFVP